MITKLKRLKLFLKLNRFNYLLPEKIILKLNYLFGIVVLFRISLWCVESIQGYAVTSDRIFYGNSQG